MKNPRKPGTIGIFFSRLECGDKYPSVFAAEKNKLQRKQPARAKSVCEVAAYSVHCLFEINKNIS